MTSVHTMRQHRDGPARHQTDARAPMTCAEAGVCQLRKIPCLDCDLHPWPEDEDTLTSWEQIGTWIVYAVLVVLSITLVCIAAGYAHGMWFTPS